jgi:hypothetical protein
VSLEEDHPPVQNWSMYIDLSKKIVTWDTFCSFGPVTRHLLLLLLAERKACH